jgi:hypothetical protein
MPRSTVLTFAIALAAARSDFLPLASKLSHDPPKFGGAHSPEGL